jgi:hypothetical protein
MENAGRIRGAAMTPADPNDAQQCNRLEWLRGRIDGLDLAAGLSYDETREEIARAAKQLGVR